MSKYGLGADFERRVAKDLGEQGYECFRAAGSHGKADVVAIKPGQILLIQCKRSGEIDREEWNEVVALARRIDPRGRVALPMLARMPGRTGIEYGVLLRQLEPNERRAPAWQPWVADQVN